VRWFTGELLVAHGACPLRGGLARRHGERRVGSGDSGALCSGQFGFGNGVVGGFPGNRSSTLTSLAFGSTWAPRAGFLSRGCGSAVRVLLGEFEHRDTPHQQGRQLSRAGGRSGADLNRVHVLGGVAI